MQAFSSVKVIFLGMALTLALSGCEAVSSAGESINNWADSLRTPKAGTAAPATTENANALIAQTGAGCPEVKVLKELGGISQFNNPANTSAENMIAAARLENVSATCQTAPASVTLEISLDFAGTLGPVGLKDLNGQANYTYPYFLTVISPTGQILSKDVFALSMVYDKGNMSIHKQDRLRQTIPLSPGQDASKFQIVAGFQLSDAELAYNRQQQAKK